MKKHSSCFLQLVWFDLKFPGEMVKIMIQYNGREIVIRGTHVNVCFSSERFMHWTVNNKYGGRLYVAELHLTVQMEGESPCW